MEMLDRQRVLSEVAYVERLVTKPQRDLDDNVEDGRSSEKLHRAQARLVELNAKLRG